jgi:hypothetical protein
LFVQFSIDMNALTGKRHQSCNLVKINYNVLGRIQSGIPAGHWATALRNSHCLFGANCHQSGVGSRWAAIVLAMPILNRL